MLAYYLYRLDIFDQILSNTFGFIVAVIYSYILNTSYTFNVEKTYINAFRYILVVISGLVISNIVVFTANFILDNFSLILLLAIIIGSTYNYFGHKYFSFRTTK